MKLLQRLAFYILFFTAGIGYSQNGLPEAPWPRTDEWPHHDGAYGTNTRFFWVANLLPDVIYLKGSLGNHTMQPGDTIMVEVDDHKSSARIWAERESQNNSGPHSLVEWTLSAGYGQDWYNISLVDGYNLPVQFYPIPATIADFAPNDPYICGWGGCTSDLLITCPEELTRNGTDGKPVKCLSGCSAFGDPEYCCSGAYSCGPQCCPATDYSRIFKDACPHAYSYAYDDASSLFRCPANSKGVEEHGPDYAIVFGFQDDTPVGPVPEPITYSADNGVDISVSAGGQLDFNFFNRRAQFMQLSIYTASGEWVREYEITTSQGSVSLADLNSGLYLVSIRSGDREIKAQQISLNFRR